MKKSLILLASLFFLASCGAKQDPSKIRIAYHPNMGGASSIITGIKQGYFEEEGLEIELVKFTSGPPEIAAMISGDIQIGYIGFGAHTLAAEGKVQIIATDGIAAVEGIRTHKDSGIDTVEKLKGRTLGTQLGTSGEATIDQVLTDTSVKKSDIRILNSEVASAVAAFIAKRIDAISVWPPYTIEIEKRLGKENINLLLPISVGVDSTASWVATPKYIEENRETVEKFIRAIYKSMDYRLENIDEVIEYVAELVEIDVDTVQNEKYSSDWMTSANMKTMLQNGKIQAIYTRQGEYFKENDRLQGEPVPVDEYIRLDILNSVLK